MAAGELVMRCFHARTVAHVLHLKTRSYATHKALQKFYEDIIDLVDDFAEAYQGEYGIIEDYPAACRMPADGLSMLNELGTWIENHRDKIIDADDTCLANVLDEIMALIRSTQYKLKFLK